MARLSVERTPTEEERRLERMIADYKALGLPVPPGLINKLEEVQDGRQYEVVLEERPEWSDSPLRKWWKEERDGKTVIVVNLQAVPPDFPRLIVEMD